MVNVSNVSGSMPANFDPSAAVQQEMNQLASTVSSTAAAVDQGTMNSQDAQDKMLAAFQGMEGGAIFPQSDNKFLKYMEGLCLDIGEQATKYAGDPEQIKRHTLGKIMGIFSTFTLVGMGGVHSGGTNIPEQEAFWDPGLQASNKLKDDVVNIDFSNLTLVNSGAELSADQINSYIGELTKDATIN